MKTVPRSRQQPARDRARRWLLHTLACGPVTVEAIRYQAHKARISWGTLRRARQGVAVSIRAAGLGSRGFWLWQIKALTPDAKTLMKDGICPYCGRPIGEAHR